MNPFSILDEFETNALSLAVIIANYNRELMNNNVDSILAEKLTLDFANILWNNIITPRKNEDQE